ncbi:MAG: nucleotide-binding protein, partial [Deltaproteobacteria bacterium]|nr:nucleotide-binding protein [Deltaproteobacteria bacterium]
MSRPLAVFVGSSSEALRIARTVKTLLKDTATVKLWNQPGIFRLSNATLESLDVAVTAFDFGVFVFSSDDDVTSRHKRFKGTRDNVLFELGLFMGRLGRDRTFVVSEDKKKLKILSDFLGVGTARYEPNGRAFHRTIRAACVKIRREMADRGQRRGTSMKTIEYGID